MSQPTSVRGNLIEASVLINGEAQQIWRRSSDNQAFVAGQAGQSYTLQVRNLTTGRIEVLSSVDGRDTLKDQPASLTMQGMIVSPLGVWNITGFRLNDNETGQFVFGDPTAAVATQATGTTRNVGVFGLAVYTEFSVQRLSPYSGILDSYRSKTKSGSPDLMSRRGDSTLGGDLGTRMGEILQDIVGRTHFTRAESQPPQVITIQYRSVDWLMRNGIMVPQEPRAFPGDTETGYQKYLR